ncbi:MAG: FAD-binding protein, partial [Betaproteobacteria bacterium]|nr:FAD-binding protein [Betaproteobacteria bacterium]
EVRPDPGPDSLDDIEREAHPVLQWPAILTFECVGGGGPELVHQVAIGFELHAINAGGVHALGRVGVVADQARNVPVFHLATNTLEGPYGGTLENRVRFTLDVIKAIRARVGPDFILGVRGVADEAMPGGLNAEEGLGIARYLAKSGMVDFLNIIRGHIDTDAGLTDVIPVQGMASAPHLDFAGSIRARVDIPIFHAAKIQDVTTARFAIASGKLDMVGMTRAHMADPHIVRKIMLGREDTIRPCVGGNFCLDRIYAGGEAYCIHNPATGRELTMPHTLSPAPLKRKVLVVGAGPAGLEAARVASERGHQVLVLEAAAKPGGQIRLTTQTARRREMISIIDWRMARCE